MRWCVDERESERPACQGDQMLRSAVCPRLAYYGLAICAAEKKLCQ